MSTAENPEALKAELARKTLVVDAKASGRHVHVVTYLEGGTYPIKGDLLFRSAEDAARCAAVLREALK